MNETYCTLCHKEITDSDFQYKCVADVHVYKFGELDEILLAHAWCANEDGSDVKWNIPKPSKDPKEGHKWIRNMMSGRWIEIAEDTPRCCDPSTELYWSM
jgi:hypothetical protein